MALPALGALFASLARVAIPTLGRSVAAEAAGGVGARAAAGQAAGRGVAASGGQRFASRAIVELRGANVVRPPAGAAGVPAGKIGPQAAGGGSGAGAGRMAHPQQQAIDLGGQLKRARDASGRFVKGDQSLQSAVKQAAPPQSPRAATPTAQGAAPPVKPPVGRTPAAGASGDPGGWGKGLRGFGGMLSQGFQKVVGQIGGTLRGLTGTVTQGQKATAGEVSQSVGKVAGEVARGQQQTGSSLANGLRNAADGMQSVLKDGFRDIAKQWDMGALFQRQGGPNRERQAEIARLKGEVTGHGSMMGQSLAPQDLQGKLADLEGLERKDEAAREQANEEIKQAAKTFGKALLGSVAALIALPAIGKRFADSMLAANEGLRQFNGQIANAYAGLDRTNLQLKYQRANATAGTSAGLADAMGDLRTAVSPIANDLANLKNIVGIGVVKSLTIIARSADVVTKLVPEIRIIREGIQIIARLLGNRDPVDFLKFLDRVANGQFVPQQPDPLAARRNMAAQQQAARNQRAARRRAGP